MGPKGPKEPTGPVHRVERVQRVDDEMGAYLAAALVWAASRETNERARKAICRASVALAERCGVEFAPDVADALMEGRIEEVLRQTGGVKP